ncbi:winged helix-turn-helix domain-containing protein [Paucibacter sp. DJ1R-11]|uniref:winged helix-turn-helix domain-containing protein n=1 Tax=Paucibacter sp. DJ1R-11 TaxID=2893556 RepID=UPI0021E4FC33|nr:winged helix-turn-helix domain-containing protein [Paucibacter sp. DJ1R-11]MCV2361873.1 winged helix-turn-helix domain-containing protein [Paucibacter sp. DJ1R-11]
MDCLPEHALQIGDWLLDPSTGQLSRTDDEGLRLDARPLRLLVYLAGRAGETIGMDELLEQVWPGVVVTQDSVYQAITALRRALGDDSKQPRYIATVPRLGYRLIAAVQTLPAPAEAGLDGNTSLAINEEMTPVTAPPKRRTNVGLILSATLLSLAAGLALFQLQPWRADGPAAAAQASAPRPVAVLPFLDLSDKMDQEPFADGMSEQLIALLGKNSELRIAARSSVFAFKGKDIAPAALGQQLGVSHVIEGSVRLSGQTMRISAQLVRTSDGFVVWTESYDRALSDALKTQAEVAAAIGAAVSAKLAPSGIR